MQNYDEIIKDILVILPTLTGTGIKGKGNYIQDPIPEEQFWLCVEFIEQKTIPTKTVRKNRGTSYSYKHRVTKYVQNTYNYYQFISNGAFIAALLYKGILVKNYFPSPNVFAAIKLIKEKKKNEKIDMEFAYLCGELQGAGENKTASNEN
jgi:hypothetical protein